MLDLRESGKLSIENSMLIDVIEKKVRVEYNTFIGCFIRKNYLMQTDLLLTASCRNTNVSKIHDKFCRLALLEENLIQGNIPEHLKVDNNIVADAMKQMLIKHRCQNTVIEPETHNGNSIRVVLMNLIKSIYIILNSWLFSRLFLVKNKPKKDILYVDTFLFVDSFDSDGNYNDRYYTGHEKYLEQEEKGAIWFVPTLIGIKHPSEYIKIFKQVKKSDRNFLVKESWLSASDYLYALIYSIIIPLKIKIYPFFRGVDVSKIIKNEVYRDVGSPGLMKALCQYRFIRRLSKEKVGLFHVVDWFENQIVDRALNMAIKQYYPKITVFGYQGFFGPEYYASLQPTCYELDAGTLPDVINVISDDSITLSRDVCDRLNLKLSPAFRFSHLFNFQDRRNNDTPIVLIALPIMIDESRKILQAFLRIINNLDQNIRIVVKHHPSHIIERFSQWVPEISDPRFEYTNKGMPELLELISVMVSSASSVCVEAVSIGVPVAIHGNRSGVTMNTIPSRVPKDLWRVFYTDNQLLDFIGDGLNNKIRNSIAHELFHPVDADGTRALFGLQMIGH